MWYVVIMAGGQGSRLWPLSRPGCPKPFLALAGSDTLIQATWRRALRLVPAERIFVVADRAHADLLRDQLPGLFDDRLLLEPVGRNTAPCNGLAAHHALRADSEATLIVLSADHVIPTEDAWEAAMRAAASHAETSGDLVAIGVEPEDPLPRYGYMVCGPALTPRSKPTVYAVERFVEKPDAPVLAEVLDTGRALRNLGMFAWRADRLLEELDRHQPGIAGPLAEYARSMGGPDARAALEAAYGRLSPLSVDHGVLQRTDRLAVVASDIRRIDVGDYSAFAALWGHDQAGNAVKGPFSGIDARGNIIYSDGPRIAAVGVEDLVVVAAGNALLICPRDRTQEIKTLVAALAERSASAPAGEPH